LIFEVKADLDEVGDSALRIGVVDRGNGILHQCAELVRGQPKLLQLRLDLDEVDSLGFLYNISFMREPSDTGYAKSQLLRCAACSPCTPGIR
jgi:hypothetical protein